MKQYQKDLSNLQWTEQGKINLENRIKANATKQQKTPLSFAKIGLTAVAVSVVSVSVYATLPISSLTNLFLPLFSNAHSIETSHHEIFQQIAQPIGISDEIGNFKMTTEALVGSGTQLILVHSLSTIDGSPLSLPDGVAIDDLTFQSQWGTSVKGFACTRFLSKEDFNTSDNSIQFIEELIFSDGIPYGELATTIFPDIYYWSAEQVATLWIEGGFKTTYLLQYENNSQTIELNMTYQQNDFHYTIHSITISPIGISIDYIVDGILPNITDKAFSSISSQMLLSDSILTIYKKDGSSLMFPFVDASARLQDDLEADLTNITKTFQLNELTPLDTIDFMMIDDIPIYL